MNTEELKWYTSVDYCYFRVGADGQWLRFWHWIDPDVVKTSNWSAHKLCDVSCPSHLVLAKLKVDVNIHRAIIGAHLMKDAFLCKAHFFTVIKLLQSKRFNSNCLAHKNYSVPCGMDIFRVLIWGALQIGLKLQGWKTFGDT